MKIEVRCRGEGSRELVLGAEASGVVSCDEGTIGGNIIPP